MRGLFYINWLVLICGNIYQPSISPLQEESAGISRRPSHPVILTLPPHAPLSSHARSTSSGSLTSLPTCSKLTRRHFSISIFSRQLTMTFSKVRQLAARNWSKVLSIWSFGRQMTSSAKLPMSIWGLMRSMKSHLSTWSSPRHLKLGSKSLAPRLLGIALHCSSIAFFQSCSFYLGEYQRANVKCQDVTPFAFVHQHKRMHLQPEARLQLLQQLHKMLTVALVAENTFPLIASRGHMIPAAWKLASQGPRHPPIIRPPESECQMSRCDPFSPQTPLAFVAPLLLYFEFP